jgi:hypothetical protein
VLRSVFLVVPDSGEGVFEGAVVCCISYQL